METGRASILEKLEILIKSVEQGEKWYRHFAALTERQNRLIARYWETKRRMEYFEARFRETNDECSRQQARVLKLQSLLEKETRDSALAKQYVRGLVRQLRYVKEYLSGLGAQDGRTAELISTICTCLRPFHPIASVLSVGTESFLEEGYGNSMLSSNSSAPVSCRDERFNSVRRKFDEAGLSSTGNAVTSNISAVSIDSLSSLIAASLPVSLEENAGAVAEVQLPAGDTCSRSSGRSVRRSKSVCERCDHVPKVVIESAPSEGDLLRRPNRIEGSRMFRSDSASKLTNKEHYFVSKTMKTFENCAKCKRRMKFYREALRCSECSLTVHHECRESAPLPCISSVCKILPKGTHKLLEFCPQSGPRVPPILINCFHELEKDHRIREVGLYRVPGRQAEVQCLLRRLHKSLTHDLSPYGTHAVTGVVKDFLLHSLSEPLVPSSMYNRFVKATEPAEYGWSDAALRSEVDSLPPCNRHTLAYVLLHFKVVEQIPENEMNRDNLTRVFAPTIVGYSLEAQLNAALMTREPTERVMSCLLTIEPTFWDGIIQRAYGKVSRVLSKEPTPTVTRTSMFSSPKIS